MIVTIAIIVLFGILLMMAETFIPGAIAGVLGFLCILTGAVLALVSDELAHWSSWSRVMLSIGVILFSFTAMFIWMRWFAVRFFRRAFTLEAKIESPPTDPHRSLGQEGVAITELRPLGRAEIVGRRFDVRCETGFAPSGSRLKFVGIEPGNLLVRILSTTK
jgi:membrane-bound serine protease (ClpP class)